MKKQITVIIKNNKSQAISTQVVEVSDSEGDFFRAIEKWNIANDKTPGANWSHETTRQVVFRDIAMMRVSVPAGGHAITS